jgi:PncC family amidohydrolase
MDITSLARAVGDLLQKSKRTLAVAESCTAGLLAAFITDIPGSSAYFQGGVIAYSNEVKRELLGVPAAILAEHGGVSVEAASAMAKGVRQLLHVDLSLAITGIAGPGGGTAEKPVGLVYIAMDSSHGTECHTHLWTGDRWENREWSVKSALELLHRHLASAVLEERQDRDVSASLVNVEARFDKEGRLTPLAFEWQGRSTPITSLGRTWSTQERGKVFEHYLVSTPGETVAELIFESGTRRWLVARRGGRLSLA